MTDILRRENAKHVAAINKAWGHQVAWLEPSPGFEIRSSLQNGFSIRRALWVPEFKTLRDVRSARD